MTETETGTCKMSSLDQHALLIHMLDIVRSCSTRHRIEDDLLNIALTKQRILFDIQ